MAMPNYEVHLMDPFGNLLDIIDEWISLSYSRTNDAIGTLTLISPGVYSLLSFLKEDGRIAVYRNGKLDTETIWFIREIEYITSPDGQELISVVAYSANYILDSRVVAYAAETFRTDITAAADTIMVDVVTQNLGSGAGTGRNISTYLDIQVSASLGPTVTKEFAWDNVLDVLKEVAQTSIEAGSPVHFDIVAPTRSTLEFRTYYLTRGVNNTAASGVNPVVLSLDRGNMGAPARRNFDRYKERNFAYAGVTGANAASPLSASDGNRIGISPFNRREVFVQAGNTSASAGIVGEAQAAVRAGRPRRVFEARILDAPGTRYGIHWNFGDRVTAEYRGETFDVSIDAVSVRVEKGEETIMARLRAED